jgi:citrate synthase
MLLVLNAGSSSVKVGLFDEDLTQRLKGSISQLGGGDHHAVLTLNGDAQDIEAETRREGMEALLGALPSVGFDAEALTAASHRVVHGGEKLTEPVKLTKPNMKALREMVPLAPLHLPPAIAGIEALAELRPDLPQYASFDTSFHVAQTDVARAYAIPKVWRDKGIQRYGFHGLSYAGMVHQFGEDLPRRLLAMHMGGGVSLCAIKDGHSCATTMGYSPLSGPTMATRAGDIDGMAVLRMAEEVGIEEAGRVLNRESGLYGLSDATPDMKTLLGMDTPDAAFAIDQFIWSVVRTAGAQIPVIIAAHDNIRNGRDPVAPNAELSHAANWLWMLTGKAPSADAERLAELDFILHAEHGSNASSFAARVTVGTEANIHGAIVTAISTLAGPAHGGAADDVMKMVQEIGAPKNAAAYVKAKRKNREAVTGFGHRVYRTEDPRARHMRDGVARLSQEMGQPEWYYEILQAVVDAMKPYSRHGLNVNVDFYSGVIYQLHGIPMDLYVPIFAIGRAPGWVAQCLEQVRANILIRPLTLYDGPAPRAYVPIAER